VVQGVLWEIWALSLHHDSKSELVKMVSKLNEIEPIEVLRDFLARIVCKVKRPFCWATYSFIKEIAIVTAHYRVQSDYAEYVHNHLEYSFT
jgi:uncharacterized protein VirK/YbjX